MIKSRCDRQSCFFNPFFHPLTPHSYPSVQEAVKFIAHPSKPLAVLLGRPQRRRSRLGPSPEWSSIGRAGIVFPPALELLVSGHGGSVGL